MQSTLSTTQRGAALLVGLIFLLLISLLAVTSMSSTVLQERMTGGQRNESLSNAGAESAMRGAEKALWDEFVRTNGAINPASDITEEPNSALANSFRQSRDWVSAREYNDINYASITAAAGASRLARNPNYVIEELGASSDIALESHYQENYGSGSVGDVVYFRTSARSTGGDPNVMRTLESTYAMGR